MAQLIPGLVAKFIFPVGEELQREVLVEASAMPTLSDLEIEVLKKLANSEATTVPPNLRLRLEMRGLIRDRAEGVFLTDEGRRAAYQSSSVKTPALESKQADLDKRGRRMPHQRRLVF